MQNIFSPSRRRLLGATAAALTASDVFALDSDGNGAGVLRKYSSATNKTGAARMFGPIHQVDAGVLNIGYAELGPSGGAPVILLHGWPYDIHSYWEVATQLADRGCRVIVPHLRGHGTTRFLDQSVPRSGQQAALGADVISLMDALAISKAILAGYDWGGRAACVAAALWPWVRRGIHGMSETHWDSVTRGSLAWEAALDAARAAVAAMSADLMRQAA